MRPDFPIAVGEIAMHSVEGMTYPCALGCDEERQEADYPLSLGLDVDDLQELIQ